MTPSGSCFKELLGDGPQVLAANAVHHAGDHLHAADLLGPAGGRRAAAAHGELALGVAQVLLQLAALGLEASTRAAATSGTGTLNWSASALATPAWSSR